MSDGPTTDDGSKKPDETTFANPFPTIGDDATDGPAPVEVEPQTTDQSPEIKALMEAVTGIAVSVKEQGEQNANIARLVVGGAKPATAPAPAPAAHGVDFVTGMPDQAEDPAAHTAEMAKRTNDALASVSYASTANVDRATTLNEMWAKFRTDHEDLAKHPGVVEQATREVVAAIKGRGGDPAAAVLGNGQSFMDAVAVQANSAIDRIRGASPPGGGNGAPAPVTQIASDATRTAGVSGGSSEHTGGSSGGKSPAKVSTLVDELKTAQAKSGFF